MSRVISFVKEIGNNENMLVEIQGSISHTVENKFNYMMLGKLTKISEVRI
jgi:hypothetical protein